LNTTTLKAAVTHGGPAVLSAGVAMLAVAVTMPGNARYPAQASQPSVRPTVTVTATAVEETPAPSPSSSRRVVAAEPAARPASGDDAGVKGPRRGGGTRSSTAPRPAPAPSTAPPATRPATCSGGVLAVHLPLGVLPKCGITVGGSK
jgi:hypothetical protein